MTTHKQLLKRAKFMGHEITPELSAELLKLSTVSKADLQAAFEKGVVEKLADDFKVPRAVMEIHTEGRLPRLTDMIGRCL